ncbi:MAG: hypothetical protein J5I50_05725 [Chitinophagaceae bacterium]|nr:hypothetical protein [Chitinophagaceae bacterium]
MKISKQLVVSLLMLIAIASLYRIMPGRPYGFAPHIAIAIFGGAIIHEKKFAFLLPLLAMFVSDVLYQILYINGASVIPGFYQGQITNYILFGGLTVFGFMIKGFDLKKIGLAAVSAPTVYFLISNSLVWASASPMAGLGRPKTFEGWLMCLGDGVPFYLWSLAGTAIFSAIMFGVYYFFYEKDISLQPVKVK